MAKEVNALMLIPICTFTLINVLIGIHPGPLTDIIEKIANGLM